jgi:fructan beta-fructosidase
MTDIHNATPPRGDAGPPADPYRPRYHFTPRRGWMNDPNGLVWFDGEYHLFFQHEWPRGWGHAISRNLVSWTELPLALAPDERGHIWSGSVVVDRRNTSGLFPNGAGLVALFTHWRDGHQEQSLAYSHDRGRTWIRYPANPVIANPGLADFRDPKVFWYEPGGSWVLVLAAGDRVQFYRSTDLQRWEVLSAFAGLPGEAPGVWECPDLVALPVEGQPGRQVWTLHLSKNGPDGSWMQYYIGDFDGAAFRAEALARTDGGRDFYAAITWSDLPDPDRRLWIGWLNNWKYAHRLPTAPWQGAMSIPRDLLLRETPAGLRLVQRPAPELRQLRRPGIRLASLRIGTTPRALPEPPSGAYELLAVLRPGNAGEVGVRVRAGGGQGTTIGYRPAAGTLFLDRRRSGAVDFAPGFADVSEIPLALADGTLRLHIFVDRSTIEVFADDGAATLSALVFPAAHCNRIELYAEGGAAMLDTLELYELRGGPDTVTR